MVGCEKVASGSLDRLPVFPGMCPLGRLSTVSSNCLFWEMGCQSRVRRELGNNRKLFDSLKQRMHAHFGENPVLEGPAAGGGGGCLHTQFWTSCASLLRDSYIHMLHFDTP